MTELYLTCKMCIVYVDATKIWDSPYPGQIRLTAGQPKFAGDLL